MKRFIASFIAVVITTICLSGCSTKEDKRGTFLLKKDDICLCGFFDVSENDDISFSKDIKTMKRPGAKKEVDIDFPLSEEKIKGKYQLSSKDSLDKVYYDNYKSEDNIEFTVGSTGQLKQIVFANLKNPLFEESNIEYLEDEFLDNQSNKLFDEYVTEKEWFSAPIIERHERKVFDKIQMKYVVIYYAKYQGVDTDTRFELAFYGDGELYSMTLFDRNAYEKCLRDEPQIDFEQINSDVLRLCDKCKEKMDATDHLKFNEALISKNTITECYIEGKEYLCVKTDVVIKYDELYDQSSVTDGKVPSEVIPNDTTLSFVTVL